jgi:HEPN domain-containing protein
LCFHAQQAAEKAIKALLIRHRVQFPYVHDLAALLTRLEKATGDLPERIRQVERLTQFAVEARYPGTAPPVREKEYREAIELAREVLRWAEKQLKGKRR